MSSFNTSSSVRLALVVVALTTGVTAAFARQLKPVAPESPLVWLYGGKGSLEVWFASPSNATPAFTATPARSPSHVVPATAITVIAAERPPSAPDGFVLYTIDVDSREFRPGVEYTASLLASKELPISIRIQEAGAAQFTVTPAAVTHAWRFLQEPCTTVSVLNSGQTTITSVTASLTAATPAGMALSKTNVADALTAPIAVGHTGDVRICPPVPMTAGTYAGSVALRANNGSPKSTAITITSRGPVFGQPVLLVLPFILFVAVLLLGLWLSTILGDWSKTGLKQTESAITLGTIAADLPRVRDRLAALGQVPKTTSALDLAAAQAQALMDGSLSIGDLDNEIARLSAKRTGAQWAAMMLATIKGKGGVIGPALTALENTALPVDQAALTAFQATITAALQPAGAGPGANAKDAAPPLTVEDLKLRRDRMASLQRWLLWGTSAMTAYSLYYVNNPAFGTLLDYFGVFAWALAFTEGGSQLLSKARWPAK